MLRFSTGSVQGNDKVPGSGSGVSSGRPFLGGANPAEFLLLGLTYR